MSGKGGQKGGKGGQQGGRGGPMDRDDGPKEPMVRLKAKEVIARAITTIWIMTFFNILQVGFKQWRRSYSQKTAKQSTYTASGISTFYTGSNVYSNYMYQAFLLIPWGFFGPLVFIANQFIDDPQLAMLMFSVVVGTGPVGLMLFLLSMLKTFSRQDNTTSSDTYFQAWNAQASPTYTQKWYNIYWLIQSFESYFLSFQMMFISGASYKYYSALKTAKKDSKRDRDCKKGKGGPECEGKGQKGKKGGKGQKGKKGGKGQKDGQDEDKSIEAYPVYGNGTYTSDNDYYYQQGNVTADGDFDGLL